MKIGWVEISSKRYGGVIYEEKVRELLSRNFDFQFFEIKNRFFKKGYLRAPEVLFNLLKLKGQKDLWFRGFYTLLTLPFDRLRGKKLVIIHHIDFSQSKGLAKVVDSLLEKIIYRFLKKVDFIVTVCEYWRQHFLARGFKNVYKIYNSFNLKEYDISEEAVEDFKKKYNLTEKPIIYLGNCQKDKGVKESYEALKDLDVYLVTSGEEFVKIPARNLKIEHQDYLKLLKSSTVVLAMSKIKEGWGRTAHEALLLKTPVIGSGLAGQRELLEGAGQIICDDFSRLKEKVEYLLANPAARKSLGEKGYNFAKNFTHENFEKEWINLISKLSL